MVNLSLVSTDLIISIKKQVPFTFKTFVFVDYVEAARFQLMDLVSC